MFCRHCGFKLSDDSAFCINCGKSVSVPQQQEQQPSPQDDTLFMPAGTESRPQTTGGIIPDIRTQQAPRQQAPQQQAAPQSFAAPTVSAAPAAAAVKKKAPVRLIALICAGVLLVGAMVFVLINFVLKKPGNAVLSAFAKTVSADSFRTETVVKYDFDGINDLAEELSEEELKRFDEDDLREQIKERYGLEPDSLDTRFTAAIAGKGDDCVIYGQFGGSVQILWNSDCLELKIGGKLLEDEGIEPRTEKQSNKDIDKAFEIISERDPESFLEDNDDLAEELEEHFAENYDKLGTVLADMLNDTDAKYILEYERSMNSYTFDIDVFKFAKALAKNKELKCTDEFKDMVDEMIDEVEEEGIDEIRVILSVSLSGGRLETVEIEPVVNDHKLGKVTTTYSDINDLDPDDLDFEEFDDDGFDFIYTPLLIGYTQKSKLKSANANAKIVFTTVECTVADMLADGENMTDVRSLDYPKKISELDTSNPIENAVYQAMKDNGDDSGYVYWEIDNDYTITLAQFGEDEEGIIGQYPDPERDASRKHDMGNKF